MSKAEKFIEENTRNCINTIRCYDEDCNPHITYALWLTTDQARKAVEIASKEMIERACEYLDGLIELLNDHGYGIKKELIIGGLKQAVKDE